MAKFVMLIGLPGSGKTQYAEQLKSDMQLNNAVTLSSDAIRAELYGSEEVQDNPEKVFELMRQRTLIALGDGDDVIYDATNIARKKRRHLLSQLPSQHTKIACVVWAKYETCIERDAARGRTVGENVIKRMLRHFQPPYYDEGWDDIKFCMNDAPYTRMDYERWLDCEHDNPHHPNTVKEHTARVMKEVMRQIPPRCQYRKYFNTLLMSANLHDIGKKFVKDFKDSHGNPCDIAHFYDHHNVGSYFCIGYDDICEMDIRKRALIAWLINVHMEPFFNSKYYRELPYELKCQVDLLHSCDVKGA